MNYFLSFSLNHYQPSFGDIDLKMCHYDADRIMAVFPSDNYIYTITRDENATGSEVLRIITEQAAEAKAGETVYIFFSGHGTYHDTIRGRKTGRVCYDRVLWDDEIVKALRQFKDGVTVVFLSDCCFAESNSRFNGITPTYDFKIRAVTGLEWPPAAYLANTDGLKCTMFALSACSIIETAKEMHRDYPELKLEMGGVFTSALVSVLREKPKVSFKVIKNELVKRIPAAMDQTPKLEYVKGRKYLLKSVIAQ